MSTRRSLRRHNRWAFTLIELLITILVIVMMAAMLLTGLSAVRETARQMRTQQMITRLSSKLMPQYNEYRARPFPVNPLDLPQIQASMDAGANLNEGFATARKQIAWVKLWGTRELMAMEMPDCFYDLTFPPKWLLSDDGTGNIVPYRSALRSIYMDYIRVKMGALSSANDLDILTTLENKDNSGNIRNKAVSAECLLLIMEASVSDQDLYNVCFADTDVADTNANGLPELIDAWGRPLGYCRWPAGFVSDLQPLFRFRPDDTVPGMTQTYQSVYGDQQPRDPKDTRYMVSRFPAQGKAGTSAIAAVGGYHNAFDPYFIDRWEPNPANTGSFTDGYNTELGEPGPGKTAPTADPYNPPDLGNTNASKNWFFPERGYNIYPLIVSSGSDGEFGMAFSTLSATNATEASRTNPYMLRANPYAVFIENDDGVGKNRWFQNATPYGGESRDNVHNHRSAVNVGL